MNKEKENTIVEKDYLADLQKIKDTINTNKVKSFVIVNTAMIMTYYEIGTIINKRKMWGNKYIKNLSNDLKDYGNCFSIRNLHYMCKIADEFTYNEIMQQPVAQIPWATLVTTIIPKSYSHEEMLWYINETYKNKWSRSQVELQFKVKAYERHLISPTTSIPENNTMSDLIKDTYVLDFLGINDIKNEKTLQNNLINNIQKFLLELGQGFAFISEKYKLPINDNDYEIDLLFYHIPSHSYLVIELKTTKFKPEYIGQLLFYTNYIDEYIKTEIDSPTIGMILCTEANSIICKTTLKNTKNLAVSKYKILEELPEYLSKKLNNEII